MVVIDHRSKIVTNDSHHVPNEKLQFLRITTLTLQRVSLRACYIEVRDPR